MPKAPQPLKPRKRPRKLPDDPIAREVAIMREATKTNELVGNTADMITRAPKRPKNII